MALLIPSPAQSPACAASLSQPHLPNPRTRLIGRDQDVAAVCHLLTQAEVALVTLTGPPGVGKTRLALAATQALAPFFPDGVCFVALATVSDPELVSAAIAQALGLPQRSGQSPLTTVMAHLQGQQRLLVLDNFEQVLPAALQVADLLATCPRLKILVTSRAILHIRAEHEFPVTPLALPDPQQLPAHEQLAQVAAVELFLQRATAVKADFALTAANAPAVAALCQRLDGLPLALELAAARVKLFTPQALLAQLNSASAQTPLRLLTGGACDLPLRQQTLRAAIAWSYQLLEPAEQLLFRRLSVFVGGFTLEAAEVVCSEQGAPLQSDLLAGIASLVDKSLLYALPTTAEAADGMRFAMLETIRDYALECLHLADEEATQQRQHTLFFLLLAERAEPKLQGAEQQQWLARLAADHDNVRAALRWCIAHDAIAIGLRLGGLLWRFWEKRGHLCEGRTFLTTLLARVQGDESTPAFLTAHATALLAAGNLAWLQGDLLAAGEQHRASLTLWQQLEDECQIAGALNNVGNVLRAQGDISGARALYEQALTIERTLGVSWRLARTLNNLGTVAKDQRDYAEAQARYAESLALWQALDDQWCAGIVLSNLGDIALLQGDYPAARTLFTESLTIARTFADQNSVAYALNNLGLVACYQGEYTAAHAFHSEGLRLWQELGAQQGIAYALEGAAGLAIACAGPNGAERALHLAGAAATLRTTIGAPLPENEQALLDRWLRLARQVLGTGTNAVWEAGQRMALAEAIQFALAPLPATAPVCAPVVAPARTASMSLLNPGLTVRELDVLRQVAAGLSNAQIAEKLVISPRTVDAHLVAIYGKIGVNSRSAATRFALDHRLC